MTSRLDRIGSAVTLSLRLLPMAGEPGHMPAGEIAAGLAIILRARLGPYERLTVASAGLMALAPEDLDTLLMAAQRHREPPWPFTGLDRKHRPPLLTGDDKRRMAAIPDFDDPDFEAKLGTGTIDQNKRALVRIWNSLSDGDRRAFLRRAVASAEVRKAAA